jgi:hypothetical protein
MPLICGIIDEGVLESISKEENHDIIETPSSYFPGRTEQNREDSQIVGVHTEIRYE